MISTADLPQDAPPQPDPAGLTQDQVDQLLNDKKTGTG